MVQLLSGRAGRWYWADAGLRDDSGWAEQDHKFGGRARPVVRNSDPGSLDTAIPGRCVALVSVDPHFKTAVEADDRGLAEGGGDVGPVTLADSDRVLGVLRRDRPGRTVRA